MADPASPVRVLWPLALGLVGASGAVVGLGLLGFGPDVVRVLLVGAVVGAVASVLRGTQSTAPTWEGRYDRPAVPTGHDVRTAAHLRPSRATAPRPSRPRRCESGSGR